MKFARRLNLVLTLAGLALLALLVWRIGPAAIIENIARVRWGLLAIITLGGVSNYIKTWSWHFSVDKQHRSVRFSQLLRVRLAGEAIANLTFAGPFMGETSKAVIVREELSLAAGLASVVIDRVMFQFLGLVVMVTGLIAGIVILPLDQKYVLYASAIVMAALLALAAGALLATRGWNVLTPATAKLAGLTRWKWLLRSVSRVRVFEETVSHYYRRHPRDFFAVAAINLAAHAILITEVFIVLRSLGFHISWVMALVIEAFTKFVNLSSLLLPGNLGAYEAGNVLLFKMLSYPASTGMTVALTRRIRAAFWAGVGLAFLAFIHSKPGKTPTASAGAE